MVSYIFNGKMVHFKFCTIASTHALITPSPLILVAGRKYSCWRNIDWEPATFQTAKLIFGIFNILLALPMLSGTIVAVVVVVVVGVAFSPFFYSTFMCFVNTIRRCSLLFSLRMNNESWFCRMSVCPDASFPCPAVTGYVVVTTFL